MFDLFVPQPLTVVEDAEGGIRYWPDVIDDALAQAWFQSLVQGADWARQRRPMYDRIVDVPRLQAHYAVDALPPDLPLAAMHGLVQGRLPAPYNQIGLNLYRDGRDSVAMHNDTLHTLQPGQPIALLSLGSPRRMLIRPKHGMRKTMSLELLPGSLLVMSHASQITHDHGIPKTARPAAPRMSVVLRARAE